MDKETGELIKGILDRYEDVVKQIGDLSFEVNAERFITDSILGKLISDGVIQREFLEGISAASERVPQIADIVKKRLSTFQKKVP